MFAFTFSEVNPTVVFNKLVFKDKLESPVIVRDVIVSVKRLVLRDAIPFSSLKIDSSPISD